MARTWEKMLVDALPDASTEVIDVLMTDNCPREVLGGLAPDYTAWNTAADNDVCRRCWDSCGSRCLLTEDDEDE